MDEPLAVLDALGEEFRQLGEPSTPGARWPRRALVVALVLALLLAGVAAAAILITRGAPLPAPNAQDLQSSGVPLAATARLAGLDVPDPDAGAPPWDIRLSRTRAGETCTAVGEVLGGQFGVVGLDHVFRALPLGGVDACGVDGPDGPVLAGARVFVGPGSSARTVVNGVAGSGVRSVTAYAAGGARSLRLGPRGSFITVYRGYVEDVRPRVVVVMNDGRRHKIAFAQSAAFEVADPGGESPWQASGDVDLQPGSYPNENCAQASQELGRSDPSQVDASLTPNVCGRLGRRPLLVLMRRFVPGSGGQTGFPWGNNPARTLVYGAAAPRVASLVLTGAGPARRLPIDARGGVFLAVLDGHVDPRALTLTARLRDGSTFAYTRSTPLLDSRSGRPLPEPAVPAYGNPAPADQSEPAPIALPVTGTVRETLHATDPVGGPRWVLRSWQGTPNPRASFGAGYHPARFFCLQVGVIEGRRLVEPRPVGAPQPLSVTGDYGTNCNAPGDLTRFPPLAQAVSYLDDPYAYAPRPLRTVISGQLRLDASDPRLLGAGSPRPLDLDANRAFLAVLPGRYWDAPLRISARIAGRTMVGSVVEPFPGPSAPATPQARAPDPGGGPPWGFAAGAAGSGAYGQIVAGRITAIDAQGGTLVNSPDGWSSGATAPNRRPPFPARFDIQGGSNAGSVGERMGLPRPEIERRTLPGQTIITGTADADVASVTLATPRDVRTLRPSGPRRAFIVVYDGQLFRGGITATVQLRNGRTTTEPLSDGPGGIDAASVPPMPSLTTMLDVSEQRLAQLERPHGDRGSAAGYHDAVAHLRALVQVIERRLAYERSHPGLLPLP